MPRHSKNPNDRHFYSYDERQKVGFGSISERIGKDSVKPFDCCCLCLKPVIQPMCCTEGHLFCKECIFECLLAQKKDLSRQEKLYKAQLEKEQEEAAQREEEEKARKLAEFDRLNNSAISTRESVGNGDPKGGASSVKTTQFEAEAVRGMRAFWLPSLTPGAENKVAPPSQCTSCPEGKEKLKLKQLVPIQFSTLPGAEGARAGDVADRLQCPSCRTTFTNVSKLVACSPCGHVLCAACVDKFVRPDHACVVCSKPVRDKELVLLQRGGTGFAAHNPELQAKKKSYLRPTSMEGTMVLPLKR